MAKITKPPIRYTSRDFDTIKQDLIAFTKRYYPSTYKDFQEAGFGSMLLDNVAYVGDILSFYLDYQVNESFLQTASEFENVVKIAQQMGFQYQPNKTSTGIATFYILVPAEYSIGYSSGARPNLNYAPILKKGTKINSNSGVPFLLATDVDFADTSNEAVVAETNQSTGRPIKYAIKTFGRVISGKMNTISKTVTTYKPFQKVVLNDNSIVEIISVVDSNGNEYFEVPNLAQDVVYRQVPNNASDKNYVKFLLQPISTPRRFQIMRESNRVVMQFGYGSEEDMSTAENNVLPSRVTMDTFGKSYVTNTDFDPNVILKSGKFGIAPANTTLTITYRSNNNISVNIPSGALAAVQNPLFKFSELATSDVTKREVKGSLECSNEEPISGDTSIVTASEIKVLAANKFFSQNRAVTAADYKSLCYLLPSSFGGVKRAIAYKDSKSLKNNINIYLLSEDSNSKLATATSSLKNNLKIWLQRHKLLSDSIDLLDAKIINVKIDFIAVAKEGFDPSSVLARTKNELRAFLTENPNDIGEPVSLTSLIAVITKTRGVAEVISLDMDRKTGSNYSNTAFSIAANMTADGKKIFIPKNAIWEVKFPFQDINGEMR